MYEPSKHVATFKVSGVQYWDAAKVMDKLKTGDVLELVAEPDNPHDENAIALYVHQAKLGYIPADQNALLAQLMFYGHANAFEARLLKVDDDANPWDQLLVGLFVVDARE